MNIITNMIFTVTERRKVERNILVTPRFGRKLKLLIGLTGKYERLFKIKFYAFNA